MMNSNSGALGGPPVGASATASASRVERFWAADDADADDSRTDLRKPMGGFDLARILARFDAPLPRGIARLWPRRTVLKTLPLEAASDLSGWLWRIRPAYRQRAAATRARQSGSRLPGDDFAKSRRACGSHVGNLGRTFAESFRLAEIAESDRFSFDLPDGFRDDPSGAVVCAPHQGNWEIAVLAVSSGKTQPAGVYRKIKNPFVDARVRKIREFLYPAGFSPKTHSAPRQLIRHAREGGTLAILADQRDMRGPRVNFFGQPTPSTPFPAMVARTLGLKLDAGQIRS